MRNSLLLTDATALAYSVGAADTTLTISPTTGAVLAAVNQGANFSWTGTHSITSSAAGNIPLTLKGHASQSANLLSIQDSSSNTLAGISFASGGTPANTYAKLSLANAESVSSTFECYVTEDTLNTAALAAYVIPPANATRIFFGRSGRAVYALNLSNVSNIEKVPNMIMAGKFLGFDTNSYQRISAATTGTGTFHHGYYGVEVRANQQAAWAYSTTHYENATAGSLMVVPGLASRVAGVFYGLASQTADILQVKNSAFTILSKFDASGFLGIGMGATALAAALQVRRTTEQARIEYDASNYYSTTVGSTGGVTFNAVGSGAGFTFSDPLVATTVKASSAAGYLSSDGSAGATGTFTSADAKTITVKDGIITAIV